MSKEWIIQTMADHMDNRYDLDTKMEHLAEAAYEALEAAGYVVVRKEVADADYVQNIERAAEQLNLYLTGMLAEYAMTGDVADTARQVREYYGRPAAQSDEVKRFPKNAPAVLAGHTPDCLSLHHAVAPCDCGAAQSKEHSHE